MAWIPKSGRKIYRSIDIVAPIRLVEYIYLFICHHAFLSDVTGRFDRSVVPYSFFGTDRNPFNPKERLIKRLIAVGGDWVHPRGNLYSAVRVPMGHCWVEGDNGSVSDDSNDFGPVRAEDGHRVLARNRGTSNVNHEL